MSRPYQRPQFLKITLLLAVLIAVMAGSLKASWSAARGNIVIFEANWCASCREVVPIARQVASQNGLGVTEIDVDADTAPKQARDLGLSVPSDEPPQVFYANRGRVTLLFNGRGYRFGSGDTVHSTILQNLQRVL